MTSNPAGRIATHAGTPWWRWVCHFEAEVFPDRDSARAAEEELIVRLQPTYNFQHTDLAAGSRAGGRVNWRKTDVIGDAS